MGPAHRIKRQLRMRLVELRTMTAMTSRNRSQSTILSGLFFWHNLMLSFCHSGEDPKSLNLTDLTWAKCPFLSHIDWQANWDWNQWGMSHCPKLKLGFLPKEGSRMVGQKLDNGAKNYICPKTPPPFSLHLHNSPSHQDSRCCVWTKVGKTIN